jgi:hypothetical protein
MNAPPFPLNPMVGQRFQDWVWNGARWVCSPATGVQVLTRTFTATGPYMPSPGLVSVVVECMGGGGAGGGTSGPTVAFMILAGGGGGSGGYSRKTLPAALVLGGVTVTIGAGGLPAIGANGGNGGATSFGALCVANGGFGGIVANPNQGAGEGGAEATAGVGDIAFPGTCGAVGLLAAYSSEQSIYVSGGLGGVMFGGNSNTTVGPGAQSGGFGSHANTGAGGSGGVNNQVGVGTPSVPAGGAAGSGICIVTEYCWADVVPNDCDSTVNVNARVAVDRDGWRSHGRREGDFDGQDFGDD